MKKALGKLFRSVKGGVNITTAVVDIALVVALIPVIKTFISDAQNLTATEVLLLSLVTLFIVLGLVFATLKGSGLGKGR